MASRTLFRRAEVVQIKNGEDRRSMLRTIQNDATTCDVRLVSVNNYKVWMHAGVLSSCSDFMKALMTSTPKCCDPFVVVIDLEVSKDALDAAASLLYSGEARVKSEMMAKQVVKIMAMLGVELPSQNTGNEPEERSHEPGIDISSSVDDLDRKHNIVSNEQNDHVSLDRASEDEQQQQEEGQQNREEQQNGAEIRQESIEVQPTELQMQRGRVGYVDLVWKVKKTRYLRSSLMPGSSRAGANRNAFRRSRVNLTNESPFFNVLPQICKEAEEKRTEGQNEELLQELPNQQNFQQPATKPRATASNTAQATTHIGTQELNEAAPNDQSLLRPTYNLFGRSTSVQEQAPINASSGQNEQVSSDRVQKSACPICGQCFSLNAGRFERHVAQCQRRKGMEDGDDNFDLGRCHKCGEICNSFLAGTEENCARNAGRIGSKSSRKRKESKDTKEDREKEKSKKQCRHSSPKENLSESIGNKEHEDNNASGSVLEEQIEEDRSQNIGFCGSRRLRVERAGSNWRCVGCSPRFKSMKRLKLHLISHVRSEFRALMYGDKNPLVTVESPQHRKCNVCSEFIGIRHEIILQHIALKHQKLRIFLHPDASELVFQYKRSTKRAKEEKEPESPLNLNLSESKENFAPNIKEPNEVLETNADPHTEPHPEFNGTEIDLPTVFVCTHCDSEFVSALAFKAHLCKTFQSDILETLSEESAIQKTNEGSLICPICNLYFTTEPHLALHAGMTHNLILGFLCKDLQKLLVEREEAEKQQQETDLMKEGLQL